MTRLLRFCSWIWLALAAFPSWASADGAAQAPYYVAISVSDLETSAAWYEKTLAVKRIDDTRDPRGQWRIINLSNEALWVELIWDTRDRTEKSVRGFVKFGFAVADVDTLADHLAVQAGERPKIVESPQHGLRIVQTKDPDGNLWQFSSPLKRAAEAAR